jgi:signal transduction histidine kinase
MDIVLAKMREFAAEILEPRNITCRWVAKEDVQHIRLEASQSKDLYLIFKEAVNNAAKYSDAATVIVRFSHPPGRLVMAITDDGQGFRPENKTQGNGLRNMRERAQRLKATLDLSSSPGKGTRIELSMPIP